MSRHQLDQKCKRYRIYAHRSIVFIYASGCILSVINSNNKKNREYIHMWISLCIYIVTTWRRCTIDTHWIHCRVPSHTPVDAGIVVAVAGIGLCVVFHICAARPLGSYAFRRNSISRTIKSVVATTFLVSSCA